MKNKRNTERIYVIEFLEALWLKLPESLNLWKRDMRTILKRLWGATDVTLLIQYLQVEDKTNESHNLFAWRGYIQSSSLGNLVVTLSVDKITTPKSFAPTQLRSWIISLTSLFGVLSTSKAEISWYLKQLANNFMIFC